MTNVVADAQLGFEEQRLDDPELAKAIEAFIDAKDDAAPYLKAKNSAKATVDSIAKKRELAVGVYRLGEYKLKISETEESEREFTVPAGTRITASRVKKR